MDAEYAKFKFSPSIIIINIFQNQLYSIIFIPALIRLIRLNGH